MSAGGVNLLEVRLKFLLTEVFSFFLEHFAVADDGIERRAQLVTHVRQKRALGLAGGLCCCSGFLQLRVLGLQQFARAPLLLQQALTQLLGLALAPDDQRAGDESPSHQAQRRAAARHRDPRVRVPDRRYPEGKESRRRVIKIPVDILNGERIGTSAVGLPLELRLASGRQPAVGVARGVDGRFVRCELPPEAPTFRASFEIDNAQLQHCPAAGGKLSHGFVLVEFFLCDDGDLRRPRLRPTGRVTRQVSAAAEPEISALVLHDRSDVVAKCNVLCR